MIKTMKELVEFLGLLFLESREALILVVTALLFGILLFGLLAATCSLVN